MKRLLLVVSLLLPYSIASAAAANNPNASADPKVTPSNEDDFLKEASSLVLKLNNWLIYYGKLPIKSRQALEPSARAFAQQRKVAMLFLINHSPKNALEMALGRQIRVTLPPSVLALLERQIDGTGDILRLTGQSSFNGKTSTCLGSGCTASAREGRNFS